MKHQMLRGLLLGGCRDPDPPILKPVTEVEDLDEPISKPVSEAEDLECASVLSVCDTQASDLTRMCISDEDEEGNPLPDWC